MINEENACHSHILNHCFPTIPNTMMLKTKVDIHVFSAVEKKFFDVLSLANSISEIEPNVSNKQVNIWCKSLQWL